MKTPGGKKWVKHHEETTNYMVQPHKQITNSQFLSKGNAAQIQLNQGNRVSMQNVDHRKNRESERHHIRSAQKKSF
uniref:Uncharacterized protein n=2 Tax=Arion vulgaris TaxID=1028688 RepID=A0A0B7AVH9_9EUPU